MIILHHIELITFGTVVAVAAVLAVLIILLPLIIPIMRWQIGEYTMKNCQQIAKMAWEWRQEKEQAHHPQE